MKNWICCILAAFAILTQSEFVFAAEEGVHVASLPPIPFKTEPTPMEEYGPRVGLAILGLLVLTGGVLYYTRKHLPKLQLASLTGISGTRKRLQVLERIRLNPRCSLYLVKLDQREILLGQCGDRLVKIDGPIAELDERTQA